MRDACAQRVCVCVCARDCACRIHLCARLPLHHDWNQRLWRFSQEHATTLAFFLFSIGFPKHVSLCRLLIFARLASTCDSEQMCESAAASPRYMSTLFFNLFSTAPKYKCHCSAFFFPFVKKMFMMSESHRSTSVLLLCSCPPSHCVWTPPSVNLGKLRGTHSPPPHGFFLPFPFFHVYG